MERLVCYLSMGIPSIVVFGLLARFVTGESVIGFLQAGLIYLATTVVSGELFYRRRQRRKGNKETRC